MKKSIKEKLKYIWILPILILTITAVPKLISMEFMVNNMADAGMGHMTFWVGVIEISCVIIFVIPKTRRIGFLLTTAYVGGIIASQWASGMSVIPGIVIQTLLWIGVYFEYPEFFSIGSKTESSS